MLIGWTAKGTRPEFDLVTGVSTGALSAPFVFLGPSYDPQLKEIYTRYGTEQLIEKQIVAGLLGGSAIADNSKLAKVIASYVGANFHARSRSRALAWPPFADPAQPISTLSVQLSGTWDAWPKVMTRERWHYSARFFWHRRRYQQYSHRSLST